MNEKWSDLSPGARRAIVSVAVDPDERRPLIQAAAKRWRRTDVENMLKYSPLIVLSVDGDASEG